MSDPIQAIVERNEAARELKARREALLAEREQYEQRGMSARVELVNEELDRLAAEVTAEVVTVDVEAERLRAETEIDRRAWIVALIRERDAYVQRGLVDKAAVVDAELARIAVQTDTPINRAEKRRGSRARQSRRLT